MPSAAVLTALRGRKFFVTGLGRWSFKGQAWNSCETCHPDGLTDNVTWFFGRGPRQTLSLDATHDAMGNPRIMNWTAVFDEVADFELNIRGNSGGVGAVVHRVNNGATPPAVTNADRIVFDGTTPTAPQIATAAPHDGLNGSMDTIAASSAMGTPRSALDEWADIRTYVTAIRSPRGPTGLAMADVSAGRVLFSTHNCAGCHSGVLWSNTRRFYTPSVAVNDRVTGTLAMQSWTRPAGFPSTVVGTNGTFRLTPFDAANDQIVCVLRNVSTWSSGAGVAAPGVDILEVRANMTTMSQGSSGFNPPSLLGVAHNAPYLHAGNARTLEELFLDTFGVHHRAYSPNFLTNTSTRVAETRQMIAFLLSIDGTTAPITTPTTVTVPMTAAFNPDLCSQFR
jgi:cytochrome c peroxidase